MNNIIEWHKATFPKVSLEDMTDKLSEECDELHTALNNHDMPNIIEELADLNIVATAMMGRFMSSSFKDSINEKMEINKCREWDSNGNRNKYTHCRFCDGTGEGSCPDTICKVCNGFGEVRT